MNTQYGYYVITLWWVTGCPKSFLACYRKHPLKTCLWFYLIVQEKNKILGPTRILSSRVMNLLLTFPGWVKDLLTPISSDKAFLSKSLLPILNLWLHQEKSSNYPKYQCFLDIMGGWEIISFWNCLRTKNIRTISRSGMFTRRHSMKESCVHCIDNLQHGYWFHLHHISTYMKIYTKRRKYNPGCRKQA